MRVRCRQPGEWWYDEATQELFLWPNSTAPDGVAAAAQEELVVPVLQTLIRFKGTVSHHDIAGIWLHSSKSASNNRANRPRRRWLA